VTWTGEEEKWQKKACEQHSWIAKKETQEYLTIASEDCKEDVKEKSKLWEVK